jgi:hypothetical protein
MSAGATEMAVVVMTDLLVLGRARELLVEDLDERDFSRNDRAWPEWRVSASRSKGCER